MSAGSTEAWQWLGMGWLDWISIIAFFFVSLVIGLVVARKAGRSSSEFFLGGRNLPWWLLGVSMVATTFSTDTPNLVTGFVREGGVAKNWAWWAFLLTGMLTVFIFARLWRRSGVMTDIEFYELRYSGKPAAFLRGFRAIYLGLFFNVMIMAAVYIAAIKIGRIMFGLSDWQTLLVAGSVTVIYSALGGLKGVVITDLFQFGIAMVGAVLAACYALGDKAVGGLTGLLAKIDPGTLNLLPDFGDPNVYVPLLVVPLAIQWWSVWYPGSEPGGGGYIAQRMLAAKDEKHAMGATMLFNCAHYALRPWPWIIVALCSLVVFPNLADIKQAFPGISDAYLAHDIAYPAMLKAVLPAGLLGLVVASLIAAYMSTISTHLNWGSSYIVNDWYKRFVNPEADERRLVGIGRLSTVVMMVLACIMATWLQDAVSAFSILLQIGAGTGLIFILRWFWWRINAWSEISAMAVSFLVAVFFQFANNPDPSQPALLHLPGWVALTASVVLTTVIWLTVTFITSPTSFEKLRSFYELSRPGGPGWAVVRERASREGRPLLQTGTGWGVPQGILCMALGCIIVYTALFATGNWIYGRVIPAAILTAVALVSIAILVPAWRKLDAID